jgi:D-alanine-D-alanine ligase-like ATP-grasp enzyme
MPVSGSRAEDSSMKPIGVFYEHPEWFNLLFAELDRRGVRYERIVAYEHRFDPAERDAPYSLVLNRVSASSYLRGHANAIFHAREYLEHLERLGVPVVNGSRAFGLDTSKARQASLLAGLGLPSPRSRVVNHVGQIEAAAAELEFPIIVKPNIGGSGALMRRFRDRAELRSALDAGELDGILGLDATAIVQEFHPPRGGSIVRVEALDNRFLYAIRIQTDPDQGFNICPADICQVTNAGVPDSGFNACPAEAPRRALQIEVANPPSWVVEAVLEIFRASDIDVGGVEYLESERDGRLYLYDVNSLSNFVTDAPNLLGFDPTARFVDFLERRAGVRERELAGVGG